MFTKIKDFNEKNTTIYFFISVVIIIAFLFVNSLSERKKENICTIPKDVVQKADNYSYDIKINNNNEVILLSIQKYKNKYLIEKTEKGYVYNYYIYYSDIYEKDELGNYNKFKGNSFVDGIDNKLIFIDYINELSLNSKQNSKDGTVCYDHNELPINICIDTDNIITYNYDNISITYKVNDVLNIEDFDIIVNNNEVDEKVIEKNT